MMNPSDTSEKLVEARQLADLIANCLPEKIEASGLTLKSKIPFKVVSLRELLIHRISALATPAVELYENSQYLGGVVLTRAVMETVALAYSLHKQLFSRQSKNNSTCQRFLYSAAIVKGGKVVLLVRKISVLPESTSLKRMRRKCSG